MYYYVTNLQQITQFQKKLIEFPDSELGFDTETTGLDPFTCTLLLMQIDIGGDQFIFDARSLGKQNIKYIVELIRDRQLVGFNLKFDVKIIKQNTDIMLENLWDIQLAEVMSENGLADDRYPTLEFVTLKYLQIELDKTVRTTFYDPSWDGVITQQQILYSAEDVQYLLKLKEILQNKLQEQKQIQVIELENKLVPVVASMELNGIKLDIERWLAVAKEEEIKRDRLEKDLIKTFVTDAFSKFDYKNALAACVSLRIFGAKKLSKKLTEELTNLSGEFIKTYIEENLNIASSAQLLNILQNVYNIPIESTNEKIINKFQLDYPIIAKIIEFREHSKKATAFGEKFSKHVHPLTGRLHVNLNQMGAQSGRFSSSPNMLNIPQDDRYRHSFIAEAGYKILAKDFSQEELRLMAILSGERNLILTFMRGEDPHTSTAALLYSIPLDQVTSSQRKIGKTMNFAVGYGSTEYGLYKNFGIPIEDGRNHLNSFYNIAYPTLRDWKKLLGEMIWKKGYSRTPFGRKRFFRKPSIYRDARDAESFRAAKERELINHVIQGCGSDIIKEALVRLYFENPFGEKYKLILQVYDEIVAEVSDEIVEQADEFTSRIMRECEAKYLKEIPPEVSGGANYYWEH